MKRAGFLAVVSAVFCLMLFTDAIARIGKGSGGWGMSGSYSMMYDPAKVETLSGEVASIDEFQPMKGMSKGVHVTLKTETETVPVHLGPEWFLEKQDAAIEKGDKLEVTGSRISFEGKPAIIASEVKKGDQTLKLRDEKGVPVWSGWMRR